MSSLERRRELRIPCKDCNGTGESCHDMFPCVEVCSTCKGHGAYVVIETREPKATRARTEGLRTTQTHPVV